MEDLRDFTFASLNGVKKNEPSGDSGTLRLNLVGCGYTRTVKSHF